MDKIKQLEKKLELEIEKALAPKKMKILAEFGADLIKKRTRLGFGVSRRGGTKERLKPLKSTPKGKSYVDQRERDRKKGKLANTTTVKKSNLTRTGQMLDSLSGRAISEGKFEVGFNPKNRFDSSDNNAEIAAFVSQKGRPFLEFSKAEIAQIEKEIRDDLVRSLNRELAKI